ncbi:MAG TPA: 2OG-Fe dioxygenase family protein [Polyangiaceae bacterium]|jgi:hypothetical protein|nr:2OG-Fe dioxygenase family protein [Polyangiaceae bacterium]
MRDFAPPLFTSGSLPDAVRDRGFVVLPADWTAHAAGSSRSDLVALGASWDDMPADPYLKDGGHYRRRRHAAFVVDGPECRQMPRRPHFQSAEYNALHGGMERWFDPIRPELASSPSFTHLLTSLASVCSAVAGARAWFVEAHQFRIDTHEGIGRPTPEGAHRDGVDFVAIALVSRVAIKGGETRVFEADAPRGLRFTITEPWSLLFLDDARVIHESTPIQPDASPVVAASDDSRGHRDTLVVTFRRDGFQER